MIFISLCLCCIACQHNFFALKHQNKYDNTLKINILQNIHINCQNLNGINQQGISFEITGTFRYPAYQIYIEDSLVASYIGNLAQDGDSGFFLPDSLSCIQKPKYDEYFYYIFPKNKKKVKIRIINICTNTCSWAYLKRSYRYCKLYHGQDSQYKYATNDYWHIRAHKYYKGTPFWIKLNIFSPKNGQIIHGKEALFSN